MCGIFGFISHNKSITDDRKIDIVRKLFLLSESRGKEASGFALKTDTNIHVFKNPHPSNVLLKSQLFGKYFYNNTEIQFIGHSRLVTNGMEQYNTNNQPVIKNGIVTIHNGIITNEKEIWEKINNKNKFSDLDSELIPTLLDIYKNQNQTLLNSVKTFYNQIYGMTNIALFFNNKNNLLLATNNGSLYFVTDKENKSFIFASEFYILETLIKQLNLTEFFQIENITHLIPNTCCLLNTNNFKLSKFNFNDITEKTEFENIENINKELEINDLSAKDKNFQFATIQKLILSKEYELHYENCKTQIDKLKRCTKCILPETFPFIQFDEQGVCNICKSYQKVPITGAEQLVKDVEKYRKNNGKPDCIVAFSGGRDSSYSLHYIKNILNLNPIAYSYDWGMITDLARRNQARMCGKLGIEHVLISADIRKKRANIHKNVSAWLKKPHLGTIPLFMAGDKQYFYFAQKLKEQNNIDLLVMGENLYEKTLFKTGFSGAKQDNKGYMAYHISTKNKIQMATFYMKQFLTNPAYINSSIFDTIGAFFSYYGIKHDYLNLYQYIQWNEQEVDNVLLNDYDWEISPDTTTTWRIGDGTAAFYNYIYYIVAGFSENDTLRSNQIRENMIDRQTALQKSIQENQPRWDSIKWYCDTIKIDFDFAIKKINNIKKLFAI